MQITLYSIIVGILIAVILVMIAATRKNIDQAGAKEVYIVLILVVIALLFFDLSMIVTNELRFLFHELKFLTLAFVAPWTLFVYLAFTGNSGVLSLRNKLLLYVIPAITVILAITNSYHHFFRNEMFEVVHNNISYVAVNSSWWYWIYSVYSYILYLAGISVLAANYYKRPRIYRNQIGLMILTSAVAILSGVASLFGLIEDYGDIGLVLGAVVSMAQYITLVKYSRKIVVTKARNLAVADIDSVVLIFDHMDRLVDTNKKQETFAEALKLWQSPDIGGEELFIPQTGKHYSISDKRLYDDKGRAMGRLIVLDDITDLKTTVNELEFITTHDYLTGLKNRQVFQGELRSLDETDMPANLICVNIPSMNLINNIFGYEYGDKEIIRLADEIHRLVGSDRNTCARQNGREFGVILRNSGESEAKRFIEELEANLSESNVIVPAARFLTVTDLNCNPEQLFVDMAESIQTLEQDINLLPKKFYCFLHESLKQLRDKSGRRYQEITELCSAVAEVLSLSDDEKRKLLLLASMADIGLLSVSPSVVQNIGSLTNDQWEEMKLHTVKGHNIALSVVEISEISREILSHHERYDGYGYPLGFKGEDIPRLSRVFSAVEFFVDTPIEKAAKSLRARKGTQFDPAVVEAILKVV